MASAPTDVSGRTNLSIDRSDAASLRHVTAVDRWLAAAVQRTIADGPVRLELWDGRRAAGAPDRAVGDLLVGDRRALLGLAVNANLYFGEAYMAGRIRIRGSLNEVIDALSRSRAANPSRWERTTAFLARANDVGAARRNVEHHYDLGNDFYSLWLDADMVYTCAYYADEAMTLDEAQRAKLDLVCRKLQLRPGETVVEAGCGWGALALHMAREYGVRARASAAASSSSRTITATSPGSATRSRRSACSSTWASVRTPRWPTSCAGPSGGPEGAASSTSSAATCRDR
jgi:cyclopropane-fatty-acyl-phospholipid synthase